MTQESIPQSRVVPVLVAALICDTAVADPHTNKKNLIGIFDRVTVGNFPSQRQVTLYIKITDAEGVYQMDFRYVQLSSGKVLAAVQGEMNASDRLKSSDFFIHFPPLPLPEPGRYEIQVWANQMYLGSTFMDASQRETPKQ